MATVNGGESSCRRAWKDSEQFRKESALWFWICEVFGIGVTAAVGGVLGAVLAPMGSVGAEQAMYPAIGGVIGAIVGGLFIFALIYCWNLFRAPYRQRDEARAKLLRREQALSVEIRRSFVLPQQVDSEHVTIGVEAILHPQESLQWSDALLVLPDGTELSTLSQTPALTKDRDGDFLLTFAISVLEFDPLPDYGRLRIRAGARDWYSNEFSLQSGLSKL